MLYRMCPSSRMAELPKGTFKTTLGIIVEFLWLKIKPVKVAICVTLFKILMIWYYELKTMMISLGYQDIKRHAIKIQIQQEHNNISNRKKKQQQNKKRRYFEDIIGILKSFLFRITDHPAPPVASNRPGSCSPQSLGPLRRNRPGRRELTQFLYRGNQTCWENMAGFLVNPQTNGIYISFYIHLVFVATPKKMGFMIDLIVY